MVGTDIERSLSCCGSKVGTSITRKLSVYGAKKGKVIYSDRALPRPSYPMDKDTAWTGSAD